MSLSPGSARAAGRLCDGGARIATNSKQEPPAAPAHGPPAASSERRKCFHGKSFPARTQTLPVLAQRVPWGRAMPTGLPACVRRLPTQVTVLRRLQERGVALECTDGDDLETFEVRLETALMALFRDEGDEGVFEALYQYASGRLLAWIASLAGSRRRGVDALDVLQDAFVNIYRYAKSFRDEDDKSFRVWSRTIVGNLIRRARVHAGTRSLDALPEGLTEPSDRRAGPIDALTQAEDSRSTAQAWLIVLLQYAEAYESLAPRDRLALDLIEVQGLSYAEAGQRLQVGLSNMKMIMFRSRRRIRSQIARRFEARLLRLAG